MRAYHLEFGLVINAADWPDDCTCAGRDVGLQLEADAKTLGDEYQQRYRAAVDAVDTTRFRSTKALETALRDSLREHDLPVTEHTGEVLARLAMAKNGSRWLKYPRLGGAGIQGLRGLVRGIRNND
jgi:hypothetical protein